MRLGVGEGMPSVGPGQLPLVLQRSLPAPGVVLQAGGVLDAQLAGHEVHNRGRDVNGIFEEGADQAHGHQLHGEAQAVVVSPAFGDPLAVSVAEVGEALQLGQRGHPGEPPETRIDLGGVLLAHCETLRFAPARRKQVHRVGTRLTPFCVHLLPEGRTSQEPAGGWKERRPS